MGAFSRIIVQDLQVESKVFTQQNKVFILSKPVFVSWKPTVDTPQDQDGWVWLAGNTLRIAGSEETLRPEPPPYTVQPVYGNGNQLTYQISWQVEGEPALIHLALPKNYLVKLSSLNSLPKYAEIHQNRLCLGWFVSKPGIHEFSFNLISCQENNFRQRADTFKRSLPLDRDENWDNFIRNTQPTQPQEERFQGRKIGRKDVFAILCASMFSIFLVRLFFVAVNQGWIPYIQSHSNSYGIQCTVSGLIICIVFSIFRPQWRGWLLGIGAFTFLGILFQLVGGPSNNSGAADLKTPR